MTVKLTQKQEAFCLAYLETGNASEAYRRAYSAEKMSGPTINRKAVELMGNGKITARLDELRKPAKEQALITYESHLRKLAELRDAALMAEQYGAAIRAEEIRGKAAGLHKDRVEIEGTTTQHMTVRFVRPGDDG